MEIEKKDKKRFVRYLPYILAILVLVSGFSCCGSQQQGQEEQQVVHVAVSGSDEAGTGTQDAPYATVSAASEAMPGAIIVVHEGEYGPIKLGPECSGSENAPTVIRPAEGDKVVIHGEDGTGISLVNVSHVTVEGLEVEGGTHGIYYESTREFGESLTDICIKDCTVHGVRGTHGICVYARNDLVPVEDIIIEGCEVYDCECGSSESVVLNGNVDGFTIESNIIHDNNNIGIDMIGFEGTAKHPDEDSGNNPYEADMVRNGVCTGNVVYNISTEGNKAYLEDGEYDPCAGGIYVDDSATAEITGVTSGEPGTPGALNGDFTGGRVLGSVEQNGDCGIYGRATAPLGSRTVEVGEFRTGPASILTTVNGREVREFEVRITRLYRDSAGEHVMLSVTDPELRALTGGIVQGMSGSPILQDGKLVGAVTHVFVNDPTRGYGISIQDMLDAAGIQEQAA